MKPKPSVLLLGSRSPFTTIVLERLIASAVGELRLALEESPRASVPVLAAQADSIPARTPHAVEFLAERYGLGLVEIADPAALLEHGPAPDLIVTACFSKRLPPAVLDWPRFGCLNVHPSLLPAYRGPSPIFWQLQAGETTTGVSVHRMVARLDAGDIVSQENRPLEPGTSASGLNRLLAKAGARLLVEALRSHAWDALPATPQDEAGASYHSWPGPEAFRLDTAWSAERAYAFMAGTREWSRPYTLTIDGKRLALERVVDFDQSASLDAPFVADGEVVSVGFSPGVVRALGRVA